MDLSRLRLIAGYLTAEIESAVAVLPTDGVQSVCGNFDISGEVLAEVVG